MDIHSIFMYRFRYSVEYWFHKKDKNQDGYCLQPHVERIIAGPKATMGISHASALDRQIPDFMVKS